MHTLEKVVWILIFPYGDIFSFLNKLKFDDSNIFTKLLIREQKIINNCRPDLLISFVMRLNVDVFCAFEVRPEVTNILVTRDNILRRKRIYLQKKKKFQFSSIMLSKVFRNSPV